MNSVAAFFFIGLTWWPGDKTPDITVNAFTVLGDCQQTEVSWIVAMEEANASQPPALHLLYSIVDPCKLSTNVNDGKDI